MNDRLVVEYLNSIASLIAIVESFPFSTNQLLALHDFMKIEEETCEEFDSWYEQGYENFMLLLSEKICSLEESNEQNKYVIAYVLCVCLDNKITYLDYDSSDKVSLWTLLPISKNKPIILKEPLNSNYRQTKIAIHPKYNVYNVWECSQVDDENPKKRSLAIKDAFSGMNGTLNHLSYTEYQDDGLSVIDVIIDCPDSFNEDCLTIAFSPMTDQDVVLEANEELFFENFSFDAVRVDGVKHDQADNMLKRFDDAWCKASSLGADVIFFPEAMGLKQLENKQFSYHKHIKQLSEMVVEKGNIPPKITFLPSFCENRENGVSIVYQDGQSLGKQYKHRPFVAKKEHEMESIIPLKNPTIIIIHIAEVHRIAMMICSDFLTCSTEMEQMLFADLGITLLLIPSFSKGEQDFISKLSDFKKYGTTVIWGNCCAATIPQRIRGGCCIAALDKINRFNECDKCNNNCKNGCVFSIKIPLHFKRKPKETILLDDFITHTLI